MSPGRVSGWDRGPARLCAAGGAGASERRPSQPLGESPVVWVQAISVAPRPTRFAAARACSARPAARRATARFGTCWGGLLLFRRELRGQRLQGHGQLPLYLGRSYNRLTRSTTSKQAARPTIRGRESAAQAAGARTALRRSSVSSGSQVVSAICASVVRACSMSTRSTANASICCSMVVHSQRVPAQFPSQMPSEGSALPPAAGAARAAAGCSADRTPTPYRLRWMQHAVDDRARALAEAPAARSRPSPRSASGPPPASGGARRSTRSRFRHARTTLPRLPALRDAGRHVVLALARHFKTGVFERGDDAGTATHDAVPNALHQVVPDQLGAGSASCTRPARNSAALL